jgi:hypothetical protein
VFTAKTSLLVFRQKLGVTKKKSLVLRLVLEVVLLGYAERSKSFEMFCCVI